MSEWTTTRPRTVAALALLLLLSCGVDGARAQNLWTGGTSSWFTAGNWSAGVPTAATNARINNGGTAQIVSDSGVVSTLVLGFDAGDVGTLAVLSLGGIPGSLTATNFPVVGGVGTGTMRISGVGSVTDSIGFIGTGPASFGTVEVTGASASWTNTSSLAVANGILTIRSGADVTTGDGFIAAFANRTATATVTDAGSTLTVTGVLTCGGSNGTDVLTVADSGAVSVTGQATISAGSVVSIGSGGAPGTFQAGGVRDDGTLRFNHTGATTFASPLFGTGLVLKDGSGTSTITGAVANGSAGPNVRLWRLCRQAGAKRPVVLPINRTVSPRTHATATRATPPNADRSRRGSRRRERAHVRPRRA